MSPEDKRKSMYGDDDQGGMLNNRKKYSTPKYKGGASHSDHHYNAGPQ